MDEIKLSNLVKKFDGTVAVDDVSIEISGGRFVVLLGPSGCGKTTTLRCIAGLETPDSGDIFIEGRRVNDLSPKERDIAMVFQNYALYPHKTVFDNIAFPLKMRRVSAAETKERVHEVAKLLNIENFLSRKPKQLSGGEQQRVALGRAIVRRPKAFLMDEPLSNLDAKLRLSMRGELKRLQRDLGVTTIYVTHDQAEAMAMADEIAVMDKGRIQQYDSPTKIYGRPSNTFVAGFVGSPPMNLLEASLVKHDGSVTLDGEGFKLTLPSDLSASVREGATGDQVIMGISPEDLHISLQKEAESMFEAEIYVVEPSGRDVIVELMVGKSRMKLLAAPTQNLDVARKVWVGFSFESLHIFDAKTGNAIN